MQGFDPTTEILREVVENLFDGVYFLDRDRVIRYWSKGAERMTGFSATEVVGRRCADNLLVHVDGEGCRLCTDLCPAARCMENGACQETKLYLKHKLGYRVPVSVRTFPVRNAKGEVLGAVEIFREESSRESMQERLLELEKMALVDPLTRLANRRHLEVTLQTRLDEFGRFGWSFGLLFIDIDHFKAVNDQLGHEAGDQVLKLVSMTLLNCMRPFDSLGRWGGEEFLGVVVNVNRQQLEEVARRCQRLVASSGFTWGASQRNVTVSIGACLVQRGDTVEALIGRADRLMYQAKRLGRDQVATEELAEQAV